ncbi:hypothetical protein [Microbulbifer aggregans]|uniref:hypothetical protein n=1 Tax=Microbulbifer aggregans TaxID=1769779 RepID=UPI001CFF1117|nr:hypothetical protein [Microbulbifer aggregans]
MNFYRIILILCACFFSYPSYAYLDPGTGTMLVQGAMALIAGAITYAGIYWKKIKDFFSGVNQVTDLTEEDESEIFTASSMREIKKDD